MNKVFLSLFVCLGCLSAPVHATSFFNILQDLTGFGGEDQQEEQKVEVDENGVQPVAETESIEELIIGEDQLSPSKNIPTNAVLLHGLDKETARVFVMEAPVGEEVLFGGLRIKVHHCEKAPEDKRPESIAFLTITENRAGDESGALFAGWMFASSPALSALDHPVYDVWVGRCVDTAQPE